MLLKRVILVVAAGACGAAVMVGCGSETVAREAVVAKPTSGLTEPVISPCDDIPDEVLRGVGLDPATESRDIRGVKQPGWSVCRWDGIGYIQSVFATTHTLDDFLANKRNTDFQRQEVGDREAYSYREVVDDKRESCDVVLRTADGSTQIRASLNSGTPAAANPCDLALNAARAFDSVIPR
ncbi:DUF3558 domain-containing protein [Rhodococcus tukisamuensis]|uniref:DUF3558 domain-containing protein n=1 Tax=Rhodococcus tukisamuensis TaxID=168276 RepID=A0A1G7B8C0_9NOCA|nr:DUF3558 domain-containing protein [Rhodococcus tukisamuensis]SDE23212.1 Protein of unknown function [Rhodococcus tukisamuensis]